MIFLPFSPTLPSPLFRMRLAYFSSDFHFVVVQYHPVASLFTPTTTLNFLVIFFIPIYNNQYPQSALRRSYWSKIWCRLTNQSSLKTNLFIYLTKISFIFLFFFFPWTCFKMWIGDFLNSQFHHGKELYIVMPAVR